MSAEPTVRAHLQRFVVTAATLAACLGPALVAAQAPATARPAVAPAAKTGPTIPADARWHDVTDWGVEGRGWADQERKRWFDRFPAKAEGRVTDAVWNLSRDSAGMMARFKTNGVDSLEIGVPAGASFEGLSPRAAAPIVFYGTSITHGACASRPGMVHTAILGRRFDRPVLNLGFSGNGKMDQAVGSLLTEVDAAVYVIDCLPNMGAADVTAKCGPLVKQLREARPATPIVLVEDRRNTNSWIIPDRKRHHDANHAALEAAHAQLVKEGVKGLFYIAGDHLYGDDTEGATDASHASDLGFMRQADIFEPVLRAALQP
jgi:hypothetical protein